MIRDDQVRLRHMLDAAKEAVGFAKGRSRTELDTNRMLSLSLVRLLEVIGEAAYGISPSFRERHPDIAWKQMSGMRNRLIHGYYDVNLDIVWKTITEDLPVLIEQLERTMEK
jgi:uncharacterized protein with HEPN domain